MQRVLLDTDIFSEILKGKDLAVLQRAIEYSEVFSELTVSAVTVHEILFGLHAKGATAQIRSAERIFTENEILVPTLEDFRTCALVRGNARRNGVQLTTNDCLIGAIAAAHRLPLVTGNTGHFEAMKTAGLSLDLINWRTIA